VGCGRSKVPTRPSDLYLSVRALGGALKTSLHESGEWRTAYTEEAVESGKVTQHPADRPAQEGLLFCDEDGDRPLGYCMWLSHNRPRLNL
jgi:hypothetical protein